MIRLDYVYSAKKSLIVRDFLFPVFLSYSYGYPLFSNYFYFTVKLLIPLDRNEAAKIATFTTHICLLKISLSFDFINNLLFKNFTEFSERKVIYWTTLNLVFLLKNVPPKLQENGIYREARYSMKTFIVCIAWKDMYALILE